MKKNCSTCTYRTEIVNSHHVSCQYFWQNKNLIPESPLHKSNIPEYAKTSGWFDFPYDFDPTWIVKKCTGYLKIEETILYTDEF